jgi:soluble P-type ATPase
MLQIEMPDGGDLVLETLVLDINGVLTLDGELIPGVESRLARLGEDLAVRLVSRDTLGRGEAIARQLGVGFDRVTGTDKMSVIGLLAPERAVMVGNGNSDVAALEACAAGIVVVGPEGCSAGALAAADVVVTDVSDALDLLLIPSRLVSTLRD